MINSGLRDHVMSRTGMGTRGTAVNNHRAIDSTHHLTWPLIGDEVLRNFSHLMNMKGCRRSTEDGKCKRTTIKRIPVKVPTATGGHLSCRTVKLP